jgi:hypothetical protein
VLTGSLAHPEVPASPVEVQMRAVNLRLDQFTVLCGILRYWEVKMHTESRAHSEPEAGERKPLASALI